MSRKNAFDSSEIMYRADALMNAASNRYRITVQVANRAKRRRYEDCLLYTSPSPRDRTRSRMPSSA